MNGRKSSNRSRRYCAANSLRGRPARVRAPRFLLWASDTTNPLKPIPPTAVMLRNVLRSIDNLAYSSSSVCPDRLECRSSFCRSPKPLTATTAAIRKKVAAETAKITSQTIIPLFISTSYARKFRGGELFCVRIEPKYIPAAARMKLKRPEMFTSAVNASQEGSESRDFSRRRNPAGAIEPMMSAEYAPTLFAFFQYIPAPTAPKAPAVYIAPVINKY